MPVVDRAIADVFVLRWHRSVGEAIEFGDPVCDFEVRQRLSIKYSKHPAKLLAGANKSRHMQKRLHGKKEAWPMLRLRLVAAESGVLSEQLARQGDQISSGDLLGIVVTEREDVPESFDISRQPLFRSVVRQLEADGSDI